MQNSRVTKLELALVISSLCVIHCTVLGPLKDTSNFLAESKLETTHFGVQMSAICEFFFRNQNTYEKYIFRHDLPHFGKSLSKNQYSLHVSKTPLLFEKPELGHSNPYSRNLRLKQGRIQIF